MKEKKRHRKIAKWTTAIFFTFLIFAGCRKVASILPDKSQSYEELKNKFFNTNSTSDIEIKKLATDIKKQDSIFKFFLQY